MMARRHWFSRSKSGKPLHSGATDWKPYDLVKNWSLEAQVTPRSLVVFTYELELSECAPQEKREEEN